MSFTSRGASVLLYLVASFTWQTRSWESWWLLWLNSTDKNEPRAQEHRHVSLLCRLNNRHKTFKKWTTRGAHFLSATQIAATTGLASPVTDVSRNSFQYDDVQFYSTTKTYCQRRHPFGPTLWKWATTHPISLLLLSGGSPICPNMVIFKFFDTLVRSPHLLLFLSINNHIKMT